MITFPTVYSFVNQSTAPGFSLKMLQYGLKAQAEQYFVLLSHLCVILFYAKKKGGGGKIYVNNTHSENLLQERLFRITDSENIKTKKKKLKLHHPESLYKIKQNKLKCVHAFIFWFYCDSSDGLF